MKKFSRIQFYTALVFFLIINSLSLNAQNISNSNQSSSGMFVGEKLFDTASIIMDFSYIYRDVTSEELNSFTIPMYVDPNTIEYPKNGLNLNYGELSANPVIDNYFELFFDFIFTKDDITIDELYAESTDLPYGFRFKVGRFLSSFGWHNQFHPHQWYFFDAPLIQTVFFGEEGLLEDAVLIGWEVPVDFFMLLGFEVGNGENSQSFGTDSFGPPELEIKKSENPNLYTFFIDSTISASSLEVVWSLSLAGGKARIDNNLETYSGTGINGDTMLGGGNLNFKYKFDRFTYIAWQTECIYRQIKGDYYVGGASGITGQEITKSQFGGYSQLVIKPFEYWRLGARAELLQNNIKVEGMTSDIPKTLTKYSGMLDLNPTEYSQIRLQYNYNKQYYSEENLPVDVNEVILQFNFSFGPHGAHPI